MTRLWVPLLLCTLLAAASVADARASWLDDEVAAKARPAQQALQRAAPFVNPVPPEEVDAGSSGMPDVSMPPVPDAMPDVEMPPLVVPAQAGAAEDPGRHGAPETSTQAEPAPPEAPPGVGGGPAEDPKHAPPVAFLEAAPTAPSLSPRGARLTDPGLSDPVPGFADRGDDASVAWLLPLVGLVAVGMAAGGGLMRTRSKRADRMRSLVTFHETESVPLLERAQLAVERGDHALGADLFGRLAKAEPRMSVAHFCQGLCLAELGRHAAAYDAFRHAYLLDPLEAAYRLHLARSAARVGSHKESMDVLEPVFGAVPELIDSVGDDDAFASLEDHPRWLAMTGRL